MLAPPHAVHLLGGVDEQEEQRERARDDRGSIERQGVHDREQLIERRRARLAAPPRAAGASERFDGVERIVALQPANDGAERGGEEANVVVEGKVFRPGVGH